METDLAKLKEKVAQLLVLAQALVVEGRPTTWRSQGIKGPITGRPMYGVYTDEPFGEVVASLSFSHEELGWDRKAHADFIAACNPQVIIDIAAALGVKGAKK